MRLADALTAAGFGSLRFSFRGHGSSDGGSLAITIANELSDLRAVFLAMASMGRSPVAIVASSFGTVATLTLVNSLGPSIAGLASLVLWYPVLDLRATFLEPELPWGRANFGPDAVRRAQSEGSLLVGGVLRLPSTLFVEMEHYDIVAELARVEVPTLVVHGTDDTYVSCPISEAASSRSSLVTMSTIEGADHGFLRPEEEATAIARTVDFICRSVA